MKALIGANAEIITNPKKFVIAINGNSYAASRKMVDNCLKVAREKFRKDRAFAIYAIERKGVIQMLNEVYPSNASLKEAAGNYIKQGFKAYYIFGGGGIG